MTETSLLQQQRKQRRNFFFIDRLANSRVTVAIKEFYDAIYSLGDITFDPSHSKSFISRSITAIL